MITADTITDEQIRELRDHVRIDPIIAAAAMTTTLDQLRILHDLARARCAEILNARKEGK